MPAMHCNGLSWLAMAGHGMPWQVMVGHGWPWQAALACNGMPPVIASIGMHWHALRTSQELFAFPEYSSSCPTISSASDEDRLAHASRRSDSASFDRKLSTELAPDLVAQLLEFHLSSETVAFEHPISFDVLPSEFAHHPFFAQAQLL